MISGLVDWYPANGEPQTVQTKTAQGSGVLRDGQIPTKMVKAKAQMPIIHLGDRSLKPGETGRWDPNAERGQFPAEETWGRRDDA